MSGVAPFVVGVTGGIGSGKSTFCRLLEEAHGCPLLDADRLGHEALQPGSTVFEAVLARFGDEIRGASGAISRPALGALVFSDPAALSDLNALVHPWILERIESRLAALKVSGYAGIVLLDAALLFDWLHRYRPDGIVLVVASLDARLERLERRGMDREEALRRIESQTMFKWAAVDPTDAPAAGPTSAGGNPVPVDWVIENSGSRADLVRRSREVWLEIERRAARQHDLEDTR
ncbi:MAG: dephospho-CoA kinase [Candidatus Eisenbacteria bacterium]|nr:dephospho-CoA kinase [Candidatus Eisenbacteria bacterium]MCC7140691.1 dephospho-CoA kinase [Candidatus Eisenbacteria bacterium]